MQIEVKTIFQSHVLIQTLTSQLIFVGLNLKNSKRIKIVLFYLATNLKPIIHSDINFAVHFLLVFSLDIKIYKKKDFFHFFWFFFLKICQHRLTWSKTHV